MDGDILTDGSSLPAFSERVAEHQIGPCRVLMLPTPVRSMVSWKASFRANPDFSLEEDLIQGLTVSLLDKGTQRRDRFALAEELENRGAQVHFHSDGLHVEFSGKALTHDAADVLALVAEQLREPLFDEDEFDKSRSRIIASVRRSMESTGTQAAGALTRRVYGPAHPNYSIDPARRIARLSEARVEDVRRYHAAHFGSNDLTMVVVGDFDEEQILGAIRAQFGDWRRHDSPAHFESHPLPSASAMVETPMPDKQNVDVRIGHGLTILRDEPDYMPLYVANYVLGGNFSARLMQTIRDNMGLTYGIRSGLYGITTEYAGHWHVAVTLSTENLARGIDATVSEVRRFVEGGLSSDELEDKKTTIVGAFKVGLATTSGLAGTLLKNAERGFDVGYLDRYPQEVESVSMASANEVVSKHMDPDRLIISKAGMLPHEVTRSATAR